MTSKIIDNLNWRYATKKFDPAKKVPGYDIEELLEALRLSASSFGLQPWKFVVVTEPHIRAKLREAAWNQPQITDSSHLIVLCANTSVDENYVKKYSRAIEKARSMEEGATDEYEKMMTGFVKSMPRDMLLEWSKKQVYLALGTLLFAAAEKRIDACPMEGFDRDKFDQILDLKSHNATSSVLCAVGYRSADDDFAHAKKVRFGKNEIFISK